MHPLCSLAPALFRARGFGEILIIAIMQAALAKRADEATDRLDWPVKVAFDTTIS